MGTAETPKTHMLTPEDLKQYNLILLEAVSGSRAYGLAMPESNTDIKGATFRANAFTAWTTSYKSAMRATI
mgnify:CR=1 FL=1